MSSQRRDSCLLNYDAGEGFLKGLAREERPVATVLRSRSPIPKPSLRPVVLAYTTPYVSP